MAEHEGILLDFCRESLQPETMDMLFDLAGAAGLEEKRTKMATGQHINATEDRAGAIPSLLILLMPVMLFDVIVIV